MNLYNLFPSLNGKKTLIAGYGLLIAGIGGLLTAVGNCVQVLDFQQCYADITAAYEPLLAALAGLGLLGVGHKIEKSSE